MAARGASLPDAARPGYHDAMPRILPELEAYQANLEERASAWDETGDEDLEAEKIRCESQIRLLEKGISEFTSALQAMPESLNSERERTSRRIEVLEQTRDLTGAYLRVLLGYIARRGRA